MRNRLTALGIGLAAIVAASPGSAHPTAWEWGQARAPSPGDTQSFGTPAAGCLAGARPLESNGPGWQVLHPERHRFYAHPALLNYLAALAGRARQESLGGLLIGDLSQPRGGPMLYGHGSHQNGLDADVLFRTEDRTLSHHELSEPVVPSLVKGQRVDPAHWTPTVARLLEVAAKMPGVDRIFVNPAIKLELCNTVAPQDRGWLRKLRPWWGHDDHFHVRLTCPADSPGCVQQKPPPEGDGCGWEVESWLKRPTLNLPQNKPNTRVVALPEQCRAILKSQ